MTTPERDFGTRPSSTRTERSNPLARYAYRAEQTLQAAQNYTGQGIVLELVPALTFLNQSD